MAVAGIGRGGFAVYFLLVCLKLFGLAIKLCSFFCFPPRLLLTCLLGLSLHSGLLGMCSN